MDTENRLQSGIAATRRRRVRWLTRALWAAAAAAIAVAVLFAVARVALQRTLDATAWDAVDLGR